LLLTTAGALKLYSLAAAPSAPPSDNAFGTTCLAGAEIGFGCWMLAGLYPRVTRWLAAVCFLAFLGWSLSNALSGEGSCGCFGPVPVNPWLTAGLDGVVLLVLLLTRPAAEPDPVAPARRWAVFGLLGAVCTAFSIGQLVLARSGAVGWGRDASSGATPVLIRPEEWVGRPCPLFGHIDVGGRLEEGEWMVLFYRPDCSECQQALPLYLHRASEYGLHPHDLGWAVIDVGGGTPGDGPRADSAVVSGSLRLSRRWVVRTPTILRLQDGIVVQVTHSLDEIQG
jgi:hypothetical protein